MKITRVSLATKLDETGLPLTFIIPPNFISVKTKLFLLYNRCGRMKEVHPASIAVKHALFLSNNTCGRMKEVHPASIAVKHALFSSNNTCGKNERNSSSFYYFHRIIRVEE